MRRRRTTRDKPNYVWQSYVYRLIISVPQDANKEVFGGRIDRQFVPGVGDQYNDDVLFQPFSNDHVLERVVGSLSHNAKGVAVNNGGWEPLTLAFIRVPEGLTLDSSDLLNLFDNADVDDFVFRIDSVCNPTGSLANAMPNWHQVNQKTRKSFHIGDKIVPYWCVFSGDFNDAHTIDVAWNLRFLWRLKS